MTSNRIDDTEAPEEVEEFEYVLAGTVQLDGDGKPIEGTGKTIHLRKPEEPQMAVLLRLQSMLEDTPLSGAQLYMDTLGALMRPEEEQWCLRALLNRRLELEAFTETATETLYHFWPELKKQAEEAERTSRTHGPAATRRPRRK